MTEGVESSLNYFVQKCIFSKGLDVATNGKMLKTSGSDLLSVVRNLTILEVKLVHEGLAIEEVIERLISNFK